MSTVERAAEVILLRAAGIIGHTRGSSYDKAERLAAAGLLADPTTSRTDEQQAVIDAAKAWRWGSVGPHPTDVALRAAVDRLAASGPKEGTT